MAYVLTLTPTFTQGFILGQLSILVILALILKYLFLDSSLEPVSSPSIAPSIVERRERIDTGLTNEKAKLPNEESIETLPALEDGKESTEWFNLIIQEIFNSYRAEIRDNVKGLAGDEVARARIERWLNEHRGTGLLDPIFVDAVSLGSSAPRLYNARILPKVQSNGTTSIPSRIQIDAAYTDTISLRLTTSLVFHQPVPFFARLPVSLSLMLNILKATIIIIPPARDDPQPTLTLQLQPDVELSLQSTSLLGSRAKLANVPKVHELIESRIRRALVDRGTWRIHLPMKKESS
ncbi:hypothetical protein CPB86DRAFT_819611 [Serendipita vermifera]|nr:hypothetical protein CPB86DRAFT_819611 [Serendipita vermifera]